MLQREFIHSPCGQENMASSKTKTRPIWIQARRVFLLKIEL